MSGLRYRYSLAGGCEVDAAGEMSLAECQAISRPSQYRDLTYIILSYIPETALEMSASDQVRVVTELLGQRYPAPLARRILQVLVKGSWGQKRGQPEIQSLLHTLYSPVKLLIQDYRYYLGVSEELPIDFNKLEEKIETILLSHRDDLERMRELREQAELSDNEEDERYYLYQLIALEILQLFMEADGDTEVVGLFDILDAVV